MSTEAKRIRGLDGLRTIAILLVFANHKTPEWHVQALNLGGFGVHLFFVLSGFLIIGILYRQRLDIEAQKTTPKAEWGRFLVNRSFRIFPIYYLWIAVVLALGAVGLAPKLGLDQVFFAATYTTNLWIGHVLHAYPDHTGHLWSLAVEEQFYLLAAPLLLFLPSRFAKLVCWAVIAVGILSAIRALWAQDGMLFYVGSLPNFALMCIGGLLALNIDRFKVPTWLGVTCLVLFVLSSVPIYYAKPLGPWVDQPITFAVVALVAPVIASLVHNQDSVFARLLDWGPIRLLGRVSYSFYLFHQIIRFEAIWPQLNGPITVTADFVATVALSTLSWVAFERPVLNLRTRLLRKPEALPPAVAAAAKA
ncbi:MAG: acyltransferase [Caulobacterales bacterium]|nr:acyltransferase [Caulobacterales bacterium]